jgi:transposase
VQIDLAALPDDPAMLQQMLREVVTAAQQQHTTLQHAMQQRDAEIDKLHLLIKRLLRQQFGRRSEQLSADQLRLALEDLEQTIAAHEAAQDTAEDEQRQRRETRPNRNHGARFRRICRAMRC